MILSPTVGPADGFLSTLLREAMLGPQTVGEPATVNIAPCRVDMLSGVTRPLKRMLFRDVNPAGVGRTISVLCHRRPFRYIGPPDVLPSRLP